MNYLSLIGLFFWIISFHHKSDNKVIGNRDSLMINDKAYFLDSITESYYNSITDKGEIRSIDTSIIKIFPDHISIKTLVNTLVFKNDTNPSELFAIYSYENTFNEIGFVHIHGGFWESSGDILINLKTGEKIFFWGRPKLSPDQSMIISYYFDLGPRYMPNGIQLFKVENGQINNVFETEIENWGPKEIKWESDSSILIKRVKVDFTNGYKEYFDYRRMKIK